MSSRMGPIVTRISRAQKVSPSLTPSPGRCRPPRARSKARSWAPSRPPLRSPLPSPALHSAQLFFSRRSRLPSRPASSNFNRALRHHLSHVVDGFCSCALACPRRSRAPPAPRPPPPHRRPPHRRLRPDSRGPDRGCRRSSCEAAADRCRARCCRRSAFRGAPVSSIARAIESVMESAYMRTSRDVSPRGVVWISDVVDRRNPPCRRRGSRPATLPAGRAPRAAG